MIDSVRDAEASRTFPHMLTGLLDTLRTTEPSFKRDSMEFQFRRVLVEIIHRIPPSEAMRPQINSIIAGILAILKNDAEDNAVTCLKALHDILRIMKQIPDEQAVELVQIFLQMLRSVPSVVTEFLSEESRPMDPNIAIVSSRSPKVLTELPFVLNFLLQSPSRSALLPLLPELIGTALEVRLLCLSFLNEQLSVNCRLAPLNHQFKRRLGRITKLWAASGLAKLQA